MLETEISLQTERPEVQEFKRKVAEADGDLIPLSKILPSGERVYVSVRDGKIERSDYSVQVAYGEKRPVKVQETILVELYAGNDEEVRPIGHWDWYIDGEIARGSGNMHKHGITVANYPWQEQADEKWKNDSDSALKVIEEYQGNGIGNLLVAVSATVLKDRVKSINTGVLLIPGIRTLQGFGFEGSNIFETKADTFSTQTKVNQVLDTFV